MSRAEVGDDVFGEDPTVNALQAAVAQITGKEAVLFVPSGTMGNQLAIATQTRPGDEVIVGEGAHPIHHVGGAAAALSGVQFAVAGTGGFFTADALEKVVLPRQYWTPRTSLVAIENTHNRSGGRVWVVQQAREVADKARALGLASHLDGARIWNASAACGVDVTTLCAPFDTVSVCFSKGLGAPAGSAFCGPRAIVDEARRFRKRWGGGMRQAGILAAGALYALKHHRARLAEDHANARVFAEALAGAPGVVIDLSAIQTNIVNVDLASAPADAVAQTARARGVLVLATGPKRLRVVTHLDVSRQDVERSAEIVARSVAAATNV
jgi:threonine aldolase